MIADDAPAFDPHIQCCWCGSDNTKGTNGYAGERTCPTCGFGGDGAPDVPCMFYRIIKPTVNDRPAKFRIKD